MERNCFVGHHLSSGRKKNATQTGNLEQTKTWKDLKAWYLEAFVSRWGVYSEYSTRILLGLSSTVSKRKLWVAQHISTALRAEITVRENEKCRVWFWYLCVIVHPEFTSPGKIKLMSQAEFFRNDGSLTIYDHRLEDLSMTATYCAPCRQATGTDCGDRCRWWCVSWETTLLKHSKNI